MSLRFTSSWVILLVFVVAPRASADPLRNLGPLELFARCYKHITQLRLPPNHPKRAAVVSGSLSPIDACMAILAEANLAASGSNEGRVSSPVIVNGVDESLAVLRNFNSLHLNFTANSDLLNSVPQGIRLPGIRTVVDETEFALHFTRALFTPGENVKQIVTGTTGMEAIRGNGSRFNAAPISPLGVQLGDLMGVRRMPADKLSAIANPKRSVDGAYVNQASVAFNAHAGGGVFGAYSHLALNFGGDTRTPDGGLAMPRRWRKPCSTTSSAGTSRSFAQATGRPAFRPP